MEDLKNATDGTAGLTDSQYQLADGLGWREELSYSPFHELVQYLDRVFNRISSEEPVSVRVPAESLYPEVGKPFYAMANHSTLEVSREYIQGRAVYRSNYTLIQASCKVTEMPDRFVAGKTSIMTSCSAECDIFLPTGLCKGLSRRNGAHITDSEVFSSIVMDYTKVMRKIQKRGYELRSHFYLTRSCDIERILEEPEAARAIWSEGGYRDYRCVTISDEGEVTLQLRQEVTS